MASPFREIRVVHRQKSGDEAWVVEIDPTMPLSDLVPELIDTLPIEGGPEDFVVSTEGTIDEPVIVLVPRARQGVRGFRQAD